MEQCSVVSYRFGEFELSLEKGSLLRSGSQVELRPKSFEVLVHLVENAGKLVIKDQLIDAVWSDVTVSDDSLSQCVLEIRKSLNDEDHSLVRTLPRRGYIFESDVSVVKTNGQVDFVNREMQGQSEGGRSLVGLGILLSALAGLAAGTLVGTPFLDIFTNSSNETPEFILSIPLSSSETIVGEQIEAYPDGQPEIIGGLIPLAPGYESGWHTHPVPVFAYIMEGEITVDYGTKGLRTYRAGDVFLEAMTWPHNARNLSDSKASVLVVYLGVVGEEYSIPTLAPDNRPNTARAN